MYKCTPVRTNYEYLSGVAGQHILAGLSAALFQRGTPQGIGTTHQTHELLIGTKHI